MKNRRQKLAIACCVPIFGTAILFWTLPIPVKILEQPADSTMRPYGEIIKTNPLDVCLPSETIPAQTSLELMLATYNRSNTAYYKLEWYEVINGRERELLKQELNAGDAVDNQYESFPIPSSPEKSGQKCFRLVAVDATPGNAITVWLNGQNDPVLRLKANMPLKDALAIYAETNRFGLGIWPMIALFCTCLGALLAFVEYLFLNHEEKDRDANFTHHQGARHKRV